LHGKEGILRLSVSAEIVSLLPEHSVSKQRSTDQEGHYTSKHSGKGGDSFNESPPDNTVPTGTREVEGE